MVSGRPLNLDDLVISNNLSALIAAFLLPIDSKLGLYGVLLGFMILSGAGLPIPEEVTLLLGGYLAYLEFIDFWPAILVLIIGIILGDSVAYFLGRFIGGWFLPKILRFRPVAVLFAKTERYFDKYGDKIVLFSRPLVGVRSAVLLLAGYHRVNFAKFLFFDIITTIPWTFFLVFLSYYLGTGLDLLTEVSEVKHTVFILLGIAIIFYAAVRFIRSDDAGR